MPSILATALLTVLVITIHGWTAGPESEKILTGENISVVRIPPGPNGGWAYRMTYTAPAPIDVYWRFKTDFDNDFLLGNKYIAGHRLIKREGSSVITENKYTSKPDVPFLWETRIFPNEHRLEFKLLNPEAGGHDFHYGTIKIYRHGKNPEYTKVVQEAYFDFFGATFWVIYPWSGGMTETLEYTARWERNTILELKDRYTEKVDE